MIYCLRFYFEEFPGIADGKKFPGLFDRISGILNCDFNRYLLDIFDEESEDDQDIACGKDERAEYVAQISDLFDEKGVLRVDSICCDASTYTDPYARSNGKAGITCGIGYGPDGMNGLGIDIIPAQNGVGVNRRMYRELLRALAEAGISVNNSLAHCAAHWQARDSFQRLGGFGFEWPENRRIRKAAERHVKAGRKDCLVDVYWGNSLRAHLVAPEDKERIRELVGAENVWEADGQFVFTLSDSAQDRATRDKRRALGQMLEKYLAPETQKAKR